jgi:hypothetical protein
MLDWSGRYRLREAPSDTVHLRRSGAWAQPITCGAIIGFGVSTVSATVLIADDHGGPMGIYLERFSSIRNSRELAARVSHEVGDRVGVEKKSHAQKSTGSGGRGGTADVDTKRTERNTIAIT